MKPYTAGLLALLASPVTAEGYWTYGAWQVYTETVNAGNYLHENCTAYTGGDGDPLVRISITSSEVGPPANYPALYVQEHAPRGYATAMRQGQKVALVVDNYWDYYTQAHSYYDNEGILQAYAGVGHPDSLYAMRAMRQGDTMSIYVDGAPFIHVDLRGFTAAYVKAMDECGHSSTGVL
ncbi:hypothetical protein [Shimia sagamensis]|uniref:Uncharacterized protein n=1 Tax=Shimia sagamensis TaxID=1566352 RepID=A0ABY1NW29_9RHOB|nr:hypothetical protein [Shimia sagamensis]SMP19887.1 hypothetical protein SAMN06265373_103464 [Shimia sagamensis]